MEVVAAGVNTLAPNVSSPRNKSASIPIQNVLRISCASCLLFSKNMRVLATDSISSGRKRRHASTETDCVSGSSGCCSSGSTFGADPLRRWTSFLLDTKRQENRLLPAVAPGRQGWEERRLEEAVGPEGYDGESSDRKSEGGSRGEMNERQATSSAPIISLLVNYSVLVSDWWLLKNTIGSRLFSGIQALPVTQLAAQIDINTAKSFLENFRQRLSWGPRGESGAVIDPLEESTVEDLVDRSKEAAAAELEEGMTSVDDDLNPAVLWEQRQEDADAGRGAVTTPGFSFSAAGLLFPYHLGVCQCLLDHGYIRETTPLAGSSAGAIVCAAVASGVSMRSALEATKRLARDCREKGTAFRLGSVLRKFLVDFLPDDAHIRASGRIRVAVTCVFQSPRGLLVESFHSKEDLINALITSSFIPGYLAPAPMTWFRDRYCIDGGISLFMPPTASEETVRVCAFPFSAMGLGTKGISPDLNPVGRASMRELFSWALEPASDDVLDALFEDGYHDSCVWLQNNVGMKPRLMQGEDGRKGDKEEMATAAGRV